MASRKPIQARAEPARMFPPRISRRNKPGRRSERSLFKAKQRTLPAGPHRRSTAIWIQLGLNRPKSKRKMPASILRPPVRIMDLLQRALLHQSDKRPTSHSRAVKYLCGSGREIFLHNSRRGIGDWIRPFLHPYGSHTAAILFAKPLVRIIAVLPPNRTVSSPNHWNRVGKNLCGASRRIRRKVFAGRNVPHQHGCGIPEVRNLGISRHRPLKAGTGLRKTPHRDRFPTASAGSKRPAREQKLWGGPPARL